MKIRKTLMAVCKRHAFQAGEPRVTIPEPYIPFIPKRWNGVLVLAEAQNHGSRASKYLKWLKGAPPNQRINRLYAEETSVGVQPWDDGSLKLAVEAALQVRAAETAVSNAVMWSQTGSGGTNKNPDNFLLERSSLAWKEMLAILNPRRIVTAGSVARQVISSAGMDSLSWRLPAPMGMNRVSGMFSERDLLKRYPEVRQVVRDNPDWFKSGFRRNKIFYACHAVSVSSD